MKTELKLAEHNVIAGRPAVQIIYGGELIGVIYPDDGPGVRIISKHRMYAGIKQEVTAGRPLNVMSVEVQQ